MTNVEFSVEVAGALNNLTEVLVKGHGVEKVVPVQDLPTEKLVADMEALLAEIKTRMATAYTLSIRDLPVGAKIRDKNSQYYGAPIVWLVADHDFTATNQTTVLAERILAFKAFDAEEPNNPDGRRSDYGNNDYQVSNIHQWLNSDKGDWFEPQHEYDQAPTDDYVTSRPYADERGFLDSLSPMFRRNLKGQVLLLSAEEVGLSDDGKALALFDNTEFRKAKPTPECVQKDGEGDANEPDWWWLRTPYASSSYSVRCVSASGAIYGSSADSGLSGIRPALNLTSTIRVKAEPDENGIYDIVFN